MENLGVHGWGTHSDYFSPEQMREQVSICKMYLHHVRKGSKCVGSYGLKHLIEHLRKQDTKTHTYIGNGALIRAALELGFAHRRRGANSVFSMHLSDINLLYRLRGKRGVSVISVLESQD